MRTINYNGIVYTNLPQGVDDETDAGGIWDLAGVVARELVYEELGLFELTETISDFDLAYKSEIIQEKLYNLIKYDILENLKEIK